MRLLKQLSVLAIHQVLGDRAESLIDFVRDRTNDPSQRFVRILIDANDRAWKALEVALAGDSWWTRCKERLSGPELLEFRKQVEAFLAADLVPDGKGRDPQFRQRCLVELRAARKANHLPGELPLHADEVAQDAGAFIRYTAPQRVVEAELAQLSQIGDGLRVQGYPNLGEFVNLRPLEGLPLLLIAVRYFFRREVERDPRLSQQFVLDRIETMASEQALAFDRLNTALREHSDKLESLLDTLLDKLDATAAVVDSTHREVLNTQTQLQSIHRESSAQHAETVRLQHESSAQLATLQAQIQTLTAWISEHLARTAAAPTITPAAPTAPQLVAPTIVAPTPMPQPTPISAIGTLPTPVAAPRPSSPARSSVGPAFASSTPAPAHTSARPNGSTTPVESTTIAPVAAESTAAADLETELAAARAVLDQCLAIPADQRHANPALEQAVAQLQGSISTFDRKTGMRRNVMPNHLFMPPKSTASATPPESVSPSPTSSPSPAESQAMPSAAPQSNAAPANADGAPGPDMVRTPFGWMPRSKRK
ncbi:hypothetical protein [Tuwongella immobilis]|uniref:Uncharacterized protein n=1 Tax=Tuwongella immobilis TaxID=692036 RepID=A0A6C2YTJ4_9BACT|nr:hypothetical protein [Tuwongella immobilis]VIP04235.1 Uncultured bacterium genome assembly Metasoil_fosmids_resub OS=uncultured bacterium PE=4 SV=1 [Tuwongella immobilis]VTS05834.1 Uncultured bacterium genome assembly Metasoil_fosmids_resub OS=uncultured bacterium PE=4 SV=1 [Tuwongella immobilis]